MTATPPDIPPLDQHQMLLFTIHPGMARPYLDELYHCLSPDEVERARQFAFERDQQRFVLSRGILRKTLESYLDRSAQNIVFDYSPHGKPSLNSPAGETPICFNVAHSHDFALIGLAVGMQVGVDVELIRPDIITDGLIRTVLTPGERVQFAAMPARFQAEAFYRLWTRKEAVLKATGSGHTYPMGQLDLGLAQEESDEEERISTGPEEEWSITTFKPHPDYAASAVAKGNDLAFRVIEWNPDWVS